jgi:hypothetical protein
MHILLLWERLPLGVYQAPKPHLLHPIRICLMHPPLHLTLPLHLHQPHPLLVPSQPRLVLRNLPAQAQRPGVLPQGVFRSRGGQYQCLRGVYVYVIDTRYKIIVLVNVSQ